MAALDPDAQRVLDLIREAGRPPYETLTPAEAREFYRAGRRILQPDPPEVAGVRNLKAPGPRGEIALRLYRGIGTERGATPAALIYFHGGGWVFGDLDTHDGICRLIANSSRCAVISVGYRLAPEHKFPAAVEDAIAAARWVSGHAAALGIDAGKLVVGGDSAGATLAATVCQDAARNGGPAILLQCLICPVLDFGGTSPSRDAFAVNYLLDRTLLEADLADYLPDGADPADPLISPLRATDLAGLPAAIIHTAEFDPMRDEGNAYAERLAAAGVAVEHHCHDGMIHNFHAMAAVLPQGRHVLSRIGEQIRRAVG